MKLRWTILAVASLALACEKGTTPAPTEVPPAPTPSAPTQATQPAAKSDPLCVGPIGGGTTEKIDIGDSSWELSGSTLTQKSPARDSLTIGAITDIKEDTEENLANLKKFSEWFKKEKVNLIVVAGDTGENQSQIEAALKTLAENKIPVFNIAGNREDRNEHSKAMMALRTKYNNVFDLNVVRRIDTAVVDIFSMPGYFNSAYIHAENGCPYYVEDVNKLDAAIKTANSPVLLVSHGGPQQKGAEGIDRTSEGNNVGDPQLTKLIESNKIPFGIFGNIHEAGGRGTDLTGEKLLAQNQPLAALYLNPGPADSVRWGMNDKTDSVGMAAIMTIKGAQATYKVMRLADETQIAKKNGKKTKK